MCSMIDHQIRQVMEKIVKAHFSGESYEVVFDQCTPETVEICIALPQSGTTTVVPNEVALDVIVNCTELGVRIRTSSGTPAPRASSYLVKPIRRTVRIGPDVLTEEFDVEEGQWITIYVKHDPVCMHCGDDDHHSYQCHNYQPEEAEPSNEDSPQYGDC